MDDSFSSYYSKHFLNLDNYFAVHRKRFEESWRMLEQSGYAKACRVLDIGGVGPLSSYLNLRFGATVSETKSDLRYELAVPSDAFDLVICTETIEHIKDRESSALQDLESFNFSGIRSLMAELRRSCCAGGSVLLTTPNASSYITLHKWLHGEALLMDPNHVRELTLNDVAQLASGAGLEIDRLEAVDAWSDHFGPAVQALIQALSGLRGLPRIRREDNIIALLRRPSG